MSHRATILGVMLLTSFAAAVVSLAQSTPPAVPASAGQFEPVYTADGRLQVPRQYREWIFLSAGLDMNYSAEASRMGHSMFDNVFVDPAAYRAFQQTGAWPERTQLVKEDRGASQKGSINQQGKFQTTDLMGVEVHVKDTKRFARFGGWAFFFFPNAAAGPAQPIPASAECYSCHREHGAVDTTFVQFYPTLKTQQRVDTSTSPPKGTDK